jgi:SNF family Na+-dependent transporter
MMFVILGVGLSLLPILFRLALKLRLGIPMMYAVLMLTVFHSWYQAHTALADGIFFAMIGLAALSWVVTLLRYISDLLASWREDRAMAELLACRVRQARACGQSAVSTEGLWR